MAINATIRIRAILPGDLDDILELIRSSSKGVEIVDAHQTREEPPQ